jgi:hypothetical protein
VIVEDELSDFGELTIDSDQTSDAWLFKLSREGEVKIILPFLSINSISSASIYSILLYLLDQLIWYLQLLIFEQLVHYFLH